MKKVLTLALTTGIVFTGFATLLSTPATASPIDCMRECRLEWRNCDADPCSCVGVFEACMANC